MVKNLRTVTIDAKGNLTVIDGWHVIVNKKEVHIPLLPVVPMKNTLNIEHRTKKSPFYLLSGSIKRIFVKVKKEIYEEDMYYPKELKEKETEELVTVFSNEPTEKFYYCIYIDPESKVKLSSDFSVLLSSWIEDSKISEKYQRIIYASMPFNYPLIIDSKEMLCVSPFAQ